MSEMLSDSELREAAAYQQLHWLASGRVDGRGLAATYRAAIERENPALDAFIALDPTLGDQAASSDARRAQGAAIGRLDGLVVAVKDNFDVAGLPTTAGLPTRRTRIAAEDAAVVERLRAAGATIIGKTNLDEGSLGTTSNNPHFGAVQNPWRRGFTAGGSSGGSAAAVAAGLCSFAIGSDTLGSIRIPASHCGVFAIKPTHGELSTRGMVRAARRLDAVGILARSVVDLAIVLQVLDFHDPADPRSRRRRVPLAAPDWEPGYLRAAFAADLGALGVGEPVRKVFDVAVARLGDLLGKRTDVDFDWHDFGRTRRAALLVMEAELGVEFAADLADERNPVSPRLRRMLDFARGKSAVDYAAADRVLDEAIVNARRVFEDQDVLVLPTVAHPAYPLDEPERANDADLTSFANLAGCPAVSLPMGKTADGLPVGLQLVGRPGSDLRLLELAAACASVLDAEDAVSIPAR